MILQQNRTIPSSSQAATLALVAATQGSDDPAVHPLQFLQQLPVRYLPNAHGPVRRRRAEHRPVVRCVRGEHGQVAHCRVFVRVGGAGQTCAASRGPFRPRRRSRSQKRMRTTTTSGRSRRRRRGGLIGDQISPQNFDESVAGTVNQSRSVGEEARAFNGALLSGAYRLMHARWSARAPPPGRMRDPNRRPSRVRPSRGTSRVDVNVSQYQIESPLDVTVVGRSPPPGPLNVRRPQP